MARRPSRFGAGQPLARDCRLDMTCVASDGEHKPIRRLWLGNGRIPAWKDYSKRMQ